MITEKHDYMITEKQTFEISNQFYLFCIFDVVIT